MEDNRLDGVGVGDLVSVWTVVRDVPGFPIQRFTHREKVIASTAKTFKTASGRTWLRRNGAAMGYGTTQRFVQFPSDELEEESRKITKMTKDEVREYLNKKRGVHT